jgi:hypothetical protein
VVGAFPGNKKGEILSDLSLSKTQKNYFFFLAVFLAGVFLAGAFFLAVAIGNHPLFKSHLLREIVQIKIYHCVRIKFLHRLRQMEFQKIARFFSDAETEFRFARRA